MRMRRRRDMGTITSRDTIIQEVLLNLVGLSRLLRPHAHEARRAGNAEHVFANGRPEGNKMPR